MCKSASFKIIGYQSFFDGFLSREKYSTDAGSWESGHEEPESEQSCHVVKQLGISSLL